MGEDGKSNGVCKKNEEGIARSESSVEEGARRDEITSR